MLAIQILFQLSALSSIPRKIPLKKKDIEGENTRLEMLKWTTLAMPNVEDEADLELSTASRKMVQSLKKTIW